jgi:hypothetical protein
MLAGMASTRRPPTGPRADHQLSTAQFEDMNRAFFSEPGPAAYFDLRLRLLSAAADAAEQEVPLRQAVALGAATFADAEVDVPLNFVAAESMNIFHHAVETMWRLLLALEPPADCPWLEMTRLRVDGLRDRMTVYLNQDPAVRQERLRDVLAPTGQATVAPAEEPVLQRRLAGLDQLMVVAAQTWLRDAYLYNATKHGFTIGVKRQEVSLGLNDAGDASRVLSHAGIWLGSLQRKQGATREKWVEVDVSIQPDRVVWATGLCVGVMRSLWQVGAARLVDGRPVALTLPSQEDVRIFAELQHGRIRRVSKDLLYDDDTDRIITLSVDLMGQSDT